jgi:hypothetical protein
LLRRWRLHLTLLPLLRRWWRWLHLTLLLLLRRWRLHLTLLPLLRRWWRWRLHLTLLLLLRRWWRWLNLTLRRRRRSLWRLFLFFLFSLGRLSDHEYAIKWCGVC